MEEFKDLISYTALFIIVISWVIMCFTNITPLYRAKKILKFAIKKIKANSNNENDEFFYLNLFSSNIILKEILEKFFKKRRNNIFNLEGKSYSTTNVYDFINFDNISPKLINIRLSNSMTGIMTGMGILGTFVGLWVGIKSINIKTDDLFLNDIQNLLEGLNIGFTIPIVGISLGLLWHFFEKPLINEFNILLKEFCSEISEKYPCIDLNMYLARGIMSHLQHVDTIPQKMDLLKKSFEETFTRFNNLQEKTLFEFISALGDKFGAQLSPHLEKMHAVIEKSHNNLNAATDIIRSYNREFQGLQNTVTSISNIHNEMVENVKQETELILKNIKEGFGITNKFKNFADKLMSTNDNITDHIAQISNSMKDFSLNYERMLLELNGKFSEASKNTLNDMTSEFNNFSERMAGIVIDIKSGLSNYIEITEKTSLSIHQENSSLNENFNSISNKLFETLSNSLQGFSIEFEKSFKAYFKENLKDIFQEISNSLTKPINILNKQFVETTEKFNFTLDNNVNSLNTNLNTFMDKQKTVLQEEFVQRSKGNKELQENIEKIMVNGLELFKERLVKIENNYVQDFFNLSQKSLDSFKTEITKEFIPLIVSSQVKAASDIEKNFTEKFISEFNKSADSMILKFNSTFKDENNYLWINKIGKVKEEVFKEFIESYQKFSKDIFNDFNSKIKNLNSSIDRAVETVKTHENK